MIINHRTLSQSTTNSPFQTNKVPFNPFLARPQITRGECEEWNPVTCESRSLKTPPEASSMVLACFVGYMGRPTEWLVSCAHSLPTLDFSLITKHPLLPFSHYFPIPLSSLTPPSSPLLLPFSPPPFQILPELPFLPPPSLSLFLYYSIPFK